MDRRAFLNFAWMAAAAARQAKAGQPRIKLSLSGRISEPIGDVPNLKPLNFDEFLYVARSTGYDAICIRPLQCNISTPLETMVEMARKTREAGLKVSMVTCDNDQPPNNDCAPYALLNITPRLNMAGIFGTKLIRCQIKRTEQLGWAQRACDEARERGLWITHLSHPDTLFGNVGDAIDCLKKINRSNFGLTYEPVNWMYTAKGYGREVIKSVAPWIINVYSQNQRFQPGTTPVNGFAPPVDPHAGLETCLITTGRSNAGARPGPPTTVATGAANNNLALWEPGGIDFDTVFQGLHEIGYTGYFTVHSRTSQANPPMDLATKSFAFLKPFADGTKG
jgi:sugar phosphate isomerase/epimerase